MFIFFSVECACMFEVRGTPALLCRYLWCCYLVQTSEEMPCAFFFGKEKVPNENCLGTLGKKKRYPLFIYLIISSFLFFPPVLLLSPFSAFLYPFFFFPFLVVNVLTAVHSRTVCDTASVIYSPKFRFKVRNLRW